MEIVCKLAILNNSYPGIIQISDDNRSSNTIAYHLTFEEMECNVFIGACQCIATAPY